MAAGHLSCASGYGWPRREQQIADRPPPAHYPVGCKLDVELSIVDRRALVELHFKSNQGLGAHSAAHAGGQSHHSALARTSEHGRSDGIDVRVSRKQRRPG